MNRLVMFVLSEQIIKQRISVLCNQHYPVTLLKNGKYWYLGMTPVLLEGFEIFDRYLVLQERNKGLVRFRYAPLNIMEFREIPLDDEAYSASLFFEFSAGYWTGSVYLFVPGNTYNGL